MGEPKKPSPLPWFWDSYSRIYSGNATDGTLRLVCVVAQDTEHEGFGDELHSEESRANAELIVEAVNSHTHIIAKKDREIGELLDVISELLYAHPQTNLLAIQDRAQKALAKHREENYG